ncbi:phage tail protein [Ferruginibacter sp.]|nr:phage tail protein [Ferruginibacter sp.]
MALEQYISEIQIFAFPFAPKNWAQCNGQVMPIAQNQALFSLLGTTYGGNGTTTFNLPDLRGRTPIGMGTAPGGNYTQGQVSGEENHTLLVIEMAPHNHIMMASSNTADQPNADGNLLAKAGTAALFSTTQNGTPAAGNFIGLNAGGQGHNNLQPYLVLNYCIALVGIFPSRN